VRARPPLARRAARARARLRRGADVRVFEAVGAALQRLGVDTAFGLLGSGNYAIVHHMTSACGIRYYGARQELAAMMMAVAHARVTGTVGVCTVHQGPGYTNTLTGLAEAVKSRTPLLLVAGDTPRLAPGGNLDVDHEAIAAALGAGVQRLRAPRTAMADIVGALRRARVERRPIVLSLPIDLQDEPCGDEDPQALLGPPIPPVRPAREAVEGVVERLAAARRPVILAGRGAVLGGAGPALGAAGARCGALLATTAQAHGLFAGNPWSVGIAGGFSSSLASRLLGDADLVLAVGASLTYWTTKHGRLFGSAALVQCDVEPAAIGARRPVDVALVGDAGETAAALLEAIEARDLHREGFRTEALARELAEFRREDEIEDESTETTIDPRTLMVALEGLLPAERTVAVDSGHFMGFPAMYLSVPDPAGFVFTQDFQAVGLGLASALGAAVARPDRLTVAVLGDGGLRMSLAEIETAVAHELPVLIVIVNDAAYGAEVHHFAQLGLPPDIALLEDRDFAGVARALGAEGWTVRGVEDLEALPGRLAARAGPIVLDCKVNPRVRAEWLEEAFRPAAA